MAQHLMTTNPLLPKISKEQWINMIPPSSYGKTSKWMEDWLLCGIMNHFISINDIQKTLEGMENGKKS